MLLPGFSAFHQLTLSSNPAAASGAQPLHSKTEPKKEGAAVPRPAPRSSCWEKGQTAQPCSKLAVGNPGEGGTEPDRGLFPDGFERGDWEGKNKEGV